MVLKSRIITIVPVLIAVGYGLGLILHHEDTSTLKSELEPQASLPGHPPQAGIAQKQLQTNDSALPHGIAGRQSETASSFDTFNSHGVALSAQHTHGPPRRYKAVQIIPRPGGDPDRTLPIGTSFIGQLIMGIDTREPNQMARVALPYGGSFDHNRKIEKGSVIFGVVSYPGDGEKAYIHFNRLLFPDGREFKIEAEALSTRDYTPGVWGNEHDGAGDRILATTGLTLLSGITDALTEKDQVGVFGASTPRPTLHNALMNGLAKSTQSEAEREDDKIGGTKDFVTVPAGTDVIVSLTDTFHGEAQ